MSTHVYLDQRRGQARDGHTSAAMYCRSHLSQMGFVRHWCLELPHQGRTPLAATEDLRDASPLSTAKLRMLWMQCSSGGSYMSSLTVVSYPDSSLCLWSCIKPISTGTATSKQAGMSFGCRRRRRRRPRLTCMAQGACPPRDHLSSHAPPPLAVTSRSCRRGDKAARGRGGAGAGGLRGEAGGGRCNSRPCCQKLTSGPLSIIELGMGSISGRLDSPLHSACDPHHSQVPTPSRPDLAGRLAGQGKFPLLQLMWICFDEIFGEPLRMFLSFPPPCLHILRSPEASAPQSPRAKSIQP